MFKLTFQTENHNFYRTMPTISVGKYGVGLRAEGCLYNIVPKGSEVPTSGYYSPRYIMVMKGYADLKVIEVFKEV